MGPHPQFLELPGARPSRGGSVVLFFSAASAGFFAQPCFRSIGLVASLSSVLTGRLKPNLEHLPRTSDFWGFNKPQGVRMG